jgi:hypothetical protein
MLTLFIKKLRFPNNGSIADPITVALYIKGYYSPDSSYSLIDNNVTVAVDGTITESPLPSTTIDPSQKYVLKAVNEQCEFEYTQDVILYPHCPTGFTLASDFSSCYITEEVNATPPSAGQNTVHQSDVAYTDHASFIYNSGYNVNGTGISTQINTANSWWINNPANTTNGPLNRCGVWTASPLVNQTLGYSVCITVAVDTIMYVGMGMDNFGIIRLDGVNIVVQDVTALQTQYNAIYPGIGPAVTFKIWHIYPVLFIAGSHALEIVGTNVSGVAAMGCEVYNLSPAAIAAATSYGSMGAGLIFSSKDYIGMPVQLGSNGIGYSCPPGFSLKYCDSPITCVRTITTPVLY